VNLLPAPDAKHEGSQLQEDDLACAAALASLGLSPARLRRLLAGARPTEVWSRLSAGSHPDDADGRLAAGCDSGLPERLARRCHRAGLSILVLGAAGYPRRLADDPEAPAVLFVRGDGHVLDREPRAAVVGTRSASELGRRVAFDMGAALAAAGAGVVSGLALGIDCAALSGAVTAAECSVVSPVAVVGTAHDTLGTAEQRRLAASIAETGAVISELPPGAPSARWRFAVRNRVMAGLADVVVVVECHAEGGALHTVRAARRRQVPVAAVPGSLRCSASEGTNALLAEGAFCVRDGSDTLALLARLTDWRPASSRSVARPVPAPVVTSGLDPLDTLVLDALQGESLGLDALVQRTGLSLASVALALERLADAGLALSEGGFWARPGLAPRP
jgi:DNA processing protein